MELRGSGCNAAIAKPMATTSSAIAAQKETANRTSGVLCNSSPPTRCPSPKASASKSPAKVIVAVSRPLSSRRLSSSLFTANCARESNSGSMFASLASRQARSSADSACTFPLRNVTSRDSTTSAIGSFSDYFSNLSDSFANSPIDTSSTRRSPSRFTPR